MSVLLDAALEPDGALDPLAALPLGEVLEEPLAGGVLPLAALLLGAVLLGAVLAEPLALDPPAAESFFVASAAEELDEDGALGVVALPDTEPEAELDGAAGVVVEPDEDDAEPDGVVVRETARSPSLSQPVSNPAPSARDTATAKVESLM